MVRPIDKNYIIQGHHEIKTETKWGVLTRLKEKIKQIFSTRSLPFLSKLRNPDMIAFRNFKGKASTISEAAAGEVQNMVRGKGDADPGVGTYLARDGTEKEMPRQALTDLGRIAHVRIEGQEQVTKWPGDETTRALGVVYEVLKEEYGDDAAFLIARLTNQVFYQGLMVELLSNPTIMKFAPSKQSDSFDVEIKEGKICITAKEVMVCKDRAALEEREEHKPMGYVGVMRRVEIPLESVPKLEEWVKDEEGNVSLPHGIEGLIVTEKVTPYAKNIEEVIL